MIGRELWRAVKGFEGFYEVSSFGRVRSLPRNTARGVRGGCTKRTPEGLLRLSEVTVNNRLRGWQTYLGVKLTKNGKHYHKMVHRLVAEAFLPNPENKREVNHLDGNKHNNHLENLEWCTSSNNRRHSRNVLHLESLRRVRCIETGRIFRSIKEAEAYIGGNPGLGNVLSGRQKTCGGYHWEYAD